VKAFTFRRVKDDSRDAAGLAGLLRMGRLPGAWIAPAEVRGLREVTRCRRKLVSMRASCTDQVHAVLARLGIAVTHSDLFGPGGRQWLNGLRLPQPYSGKAWSLLHLTGELTAETGMPGEVIADLLAGDRGYQVIQQLPGIGPVLAAVIVAEAGDVTRFRFAAYLCSWAGLTPRHREPGLKAARGRVSKQGSRALRRALGRLTPHSAANAASPRSRPGLSPAVTSRTAALPALAPCSPSSAGATASTSSVMRLGRAEISASGALMRRATPGKGAGDRAAAAGLLVQTGAPGDKPCGAQPGQRLAQRRAAGDQDRLELVDRLAAGLDRRVLGDIADAYLLDSPVAALGDGGSASADHRDGGGPGIDGISLAAAGPVIALSVTVASVVATCVMMFGSAGAGQPGAWPERAPAGFPGRPQPHGGTSSQVSVTCSLYPSQNVSRLPPHRASVS